MKRLSPKMRTVLGHLANGATLYTSSQFGSGGPRAWLDVAFEAGVSRATFTALLIRGLLACVTPRRRFKPDRRGVFHAVVQHSWRLSAKGKRITRC